MEFSAVDMEFEITKTLRPEPNSCSLTIYGLKKSSRDLLDSLNLYDPKQLKTAPKARGNVAASASVKAAKTGKIRVEIEAGYKKQRSLIFRGDLRRAISSHDGTSWKTTIEGEDGGTSVLSARVAESFPAGTLKYAVVQRCATAMGVGLGNIIEVSDLITGVFDTGTVLDGSTADELKGILRRMKLTYSIQNGVLQFQRTGSGVGLRVNAVVLSRLTGLVGRPEKDATGEVKATCLLIPNVSAGSYAFLDSESFTGVYRISGVVHKGDTRGDDWYHELILLPG